MVHTESSLRPNFHRIYPAAAAKWGWACRGIETASSIHVGGAPSQPGDVVVARIHRISNHSRIVETSGARRRIYPGDLIVGVLGHRYATDAFHGLAEIKSGRAHLMTNAGMVGRVQARNRAIKAPTELEVLGGLIDPKTGQIVNLIDQRFSPRADREVQAHVVLVMGTGMNAGKTTSATKLIRGLLAQGLEVAAVKITGSVSPGDRSELADTGAGYVADFSDYGFPSTYLLPEERLLSLARTMLADADAHFPQVIVAEVADGVLQRETDIIMRRLQSVVHGAVLAAPCALSAMAGAEAIEQAGLQLHAITGIISNSPLFMEELEITCGRTVATSNDAGESLGQAVAESLGLNVSVTWTPEKPKLH